jgi:hypothetical protein
MKQLFLFLSLVASVTIFAQNTAVQSIQTLTNQADDSGHEIEQVIRQYYSALEQSMQNNDDNKESLLKLLDTDFTAVGYTMSVNGEQLKTITSLAECKKQLAALNQAQSFSVRFEVENTQFSQSTEFFAFANFHVFVTASLNNEEIMKFRSIVNCYMRRDEAGHWLLFETNGVNLFSNQEMVICPITIAKPSKDNLHYSVTIISPSGAGFNTEVIAFTFKDIDKKTTITFAQNVYVIENAQLSCVKENGQTINRPLGRANGRLESINLILTQHLYKEKCLDFKTIAN